MKKITLFAFAAVAISLTSCKKDRTCECTDSIVSKTSTEPGYTYTAEPATTTSTKYTKVKKSNDLVKTCVSSETTSTQNSRYISGGTLKNSVVTTVTKSDCKIK